MEVRISKSLDDIGADAWNSLLENDYPFLSFAFLSALEHSQCVGEDYGWLPHHLTVFDHDELIAATPLYLKNNSYGEFVFDWNWADAYARSGLPYYPKLVSAIPYTPATGQRLLVKTGRSVDKIRRVLIDAATDLAKQLDASSVHWLFTTADENDTLIEYNYLQRKDCQYHWFNRDYTDFDDFLSQLSSSKRKKIKRERRRVQEQNIAIKIVHGNDASAEQIALADYFYRITFTNKSGYATFNREFFTEISQTMGDQLVLFFAYENNQPVAGTICYRGNGYLYGRHWGCNKNLHSLHFELCYYQGIEYCIDNKLHCFEPGAQGEHKISRGFIPIETRSTHWVSHPEFSKAIRHYLKFEDQHISDYKKELERHLPYRKDDS